MNLHGIASRAVRAVNPMIDVFINVSTGYTTENYKQIPTYDITTVKGQMQPMGVNDLQKMQGLNVQGVSQKIYLTGNFGGLFRVLGKGGDLLTIGDITYLVVGVLERWPDWSAVAVKAQVDG